MAMWPKLSEMSCTELEEMAKAIKAEQDKRDASRFNELAKAAADALNALKMEYPWVSYDIEWTCEDCGECIEANIFDGTNRFEASRFRRG